MHRRCPGAPEQNSRITVGEDAAGDVVGPLVTSLDDPNWFVPTADVFVGDAQPCDLMDPDLPKPQRYAPGP
jgi:hypothetical protein